MRLTIVQLSDIHFSDRGNPIESRADKLAAAISAIDPLSRTYLIILSGDIANTGQKIEYDTALTFFGGLRDNIANRAPGATVHYFAVPGNHDCYLPTDEEKLRATLVAGISPNLSTVRNPDQSLIEALLQSQKEYFAFANTLCSNKPTGRERLCSTLLLPAKDHKIRINLYNSALLSTRNEQQAQLSLPIEVFRADIPLDQDADLTISVFHHPYYWLNAEVATAFRTFIDSSCDVALTGHQHHLHSYSKSTPTGETILYSEGHALQDTHNKRVSLFTAIAYDFSRSIRLITTYEWRDTDYKPKLTANWEAYVRSRLFNPGLTPTGEFLTSLSTSSIGLTHPVKGPVEIQDVFVYTDVSARSLANPNVHTTVRGENLFRYFGEHPKFIVHGVPFSGKTALAKTITKQWLRERSFYPILISGRAIRESEEDALLSLIRGSVEAAYGKDSFEKYKQLPVKLRTLVVDDWDDSPLNSQQSHRFIDFANTFFGKLIFFADGFSYIQQILNYLSGSNSTLDFELLSLQEMSHVERGELIERWLELSTQGPNKDPNRQVVETEQLVQNLIGKNTLPSLPFIVLSILQAAERKEDTLPDNGSFGYLYEVLITTALSVTVGGKPQLDKKYTFLGILAFELFRSGIDLIGRSTVDSVVDKHSSDFKIKIDRETLIRDLLNARVLVEEQGNISFGYSHFFFYFLARYFRDNLKGSQESQLRGYLNQIANCLNSGSNGIFLMFFMYLTHDEALTKRFLDIGDSILAEVAPGTLTTEVDFYNFKTTTQDSPAVPEVIDFAGGRKRRREIADTMKRDFQTEPGNPLTQLSLNESGYSDDLPVLTKIEYAASCVEILGQILRNFTGSLPGSKKTEILRTTYLLSLRSLRVMLNMLSDGTARIEEELAKRALSKPSDRAIVKRVQQLLPILAEMLGVGAIRRLSTNVGSPDIDGSAYAEVAESIKGNRVAELINLAIQLDHTEEYPLKQIQHLLYTFKDNLYCHQVLKDLVIGHMYLFEVKRDMRQRVLNLFKIGTPSEGVLRNSNKRLRANDQDNQT